MDVLLQIDGDILLFIQEHVRNDFLTPIMKTITVISGFGGLFWIMMALTMLVIKRTRKPGICVSCSLALSGIFTNAMIKLLVDRVRPYDTIDGLTILVDRPTDSSFPSGHTSIAFAAAVALCLSLPLIMKKTIAHRIGVLFVVLAACIALSRLYVGVHYPSDVLAGILLGIVYGLAGTAAGKRIVKKLPPRWLETAPNDRVINR